MNPEQARRELIEHGFEIPGDPQLESRFLSTNVDHPEWWTSTDGDSTEIEVSVLIGGLVRGLQPESVVETGAAFGQTSWFIGVALAVNKHGRLVSLEPDVRRAALARERCEGLPVEVLELGSMDYTPAGPIDFLFCDSVVELRAQEFLRFREWMPQGAVVLFHDSRPGSVVHDSLGYVEQGEYGGYIKSVDLRTPRGLTLGVVL